MSTAFKAADGGGGVRSTVPFRDGPGTVCAMAAKQPAPIASCHGTSRTRDGSGRQALGADEVIDLHKEDAHARILEIRRARS